MLCAPVNQSAQRWGVVGTCASWPSLAARGMARKGDDGGEMAERSQLALECVDRCLPLLTAVHRRSPLLTKCSEIFRNVPQCSMGAKRQNEPILLRDIGKRGIGGRLQTTTDVDF